MAKALAEKLGYTYIDSGAMYRAITLYFLDHEVDILNHAQVLHALGQISLRFENNKIYLNNSCAEPAIRDMRISDQVSQVSAIEEVRHFAVKQQQELGQEKGIVMDGRDIGTAVFPDAELKIYLFASSDIRAQRRYEEMRAKGYLTDFDQIAENLKQRDFIDSTREVSPLRKAEDAIELDNSFLTFEETVDVAYEMALGKIQAS